MPLLTLEQIHTFHAKERQIFAKLVMTFARTPAQSLLVIATWLWLEDCGYENLFPILVCLPDQLIIALANEAVMCFQCLVYNTPPGPFLKIPYTAEYMTKPISLAMIYSKRYTNIIGIKNFLNTVCARIFSDILQRVLPSSSSSSLFPRNRYPLHIPGFPHPTFGSINVLPYQGFFANNNMLIFPNDIWGWNTSGAGPEKERTMFLTFSRGFPVCEEEVRFIFTKTYGDHCVKGIFMQQCNIKMGEQPLYARLVLDSVATVDRVLQGAKDGVKKINIKKKHIWARKYEDREPTS